MSRAGYIIRRFKEENEALVNIISQLKAQRKKAYKDRDATEGLLAGLKDKYMECEKALMKTLEAKSEAQRKIVELEREKSGLNKTIDSMRTFDGK